MKVSVPDLDVTVKCDTCNAELSADFDERRVIITVEPCKKCLDAKYDEGFTEGVED